MSFARSHDARFRAGVIREVVASGALLPTSLPTTKVSAGNIPDQSSSRANARSPHQMRRRMIMTMSSKILKSWKILTAALLLSAGATTSASAQGWFFGQQEPAAYQAMHPDRDVLNGGALTPAGRMGLERPYGAAPVYPYAAYGHHDWYNRPEYRR
jgi:hypothetical protein